MDGMLINSQRLEESIAVDEFLANLPDFKRVKAFTALSGEREYQESLHKKTGQDPISIPGELALLKVYLDKAFVTYADTFGDTGEKPTMDIIRKITAIGLRALENYGCPLRDIKGSLAARPPEHSAKYMADHPVPANQVEEKDGLLQMKEPEAEKTGIYMAGKIHYEQYLRTILQEALDKYYEFKALEKHIERYKNVLRAAPEEVTKLDIRFARVQQELLEDITTPSSEEISEDEGRTRNMGT